MSVRRVAVTDESRRDAEETLERYRRRRQEAAEQAE